MKSVQFNFLSKLDFILGVVYIQATLKPETIKIVVLMISSLIILFTLHCTVA